MIIIKKAEALSALVSQQKNQKKRTGFVPTMGALHQGHYSLFAAAKKESDFVVGSIFINPSQFNNPDDFKHYPVTMERDLEGLIRAGCDVLFLPDEAVMYPPGYQQKHYELGRLETVLEGKFRPGHFQGVCNAVDRLLQMVQPDLLFLGQKDYQQCLVIARLLQRTNQQQIKIITVPTVREPDGLAMSSRNLRLTKEQRQKATALYHALLFIKNNRHIKTPAELQQEATQQLEQQGFQVDYVTIAEADSLEQAHNTCKPSMALAAASIDGIRLIDNLVL